MNRIRFCMVNQIRKFCVVKESAQAAVGLQEIVQKKPTPSKIDPSKLPGKTKIDADTIALLERLSLVDCANKEGIETLEAAIQFADQIQQVDTTNVEPLITVLEDIGLRVRNDEIIQETTKSDILRNATITEEDYFVAPPGNIPLEPREDPMFEKEEEN